MHGRQHQPRRDRNRGREILHGREQVGGYRVARNGGRGIRLRAGRLILLPRVIGAARHLLHGLGDAQARGDGAGVRDAGGGQQNQCT